MFVLFKMLAGARTVIGNNYQELGPITLPVSNYEAMGYKL